MTQLTASIASRSGQVRDARLEEHDLREHVDPVGDELAIEVAAAYPAHALLAVGADAAAPAASERPSARRCATVALPTGDQRKAVPDVASAVGVLGRPGLSLPRLQRRRAITTEAHLRLLTRQRLGEPVAPVPGARSTLPPPDADAAPARHVTAAVRRVRTTRNGQLYRTQSADRTGGNTATHPDTRPTTPPRTSCRNVRSSSSWLAGCFRRAIVEGERAATGNGRVDRHPRLPRRGLRARGALRSRRRHDRPARAAGQLDARTRVRRGRAVPGLWRSHVGARDTDRRVARAYGRRGHRMRPTA